MGCNDAILQPTNNPFGTAILLNYTPCNDVVTNVNEFNSNLIAFIYPNPTQATLTVKFNANNTNNTVKLIDVAGKIVYQTSTSNALLNIPVSQFDKGIYFITINDGLNTSVKKIIIN